MSRKSFANTAIISTVGLIITRLLSIIYLPAFSAMVNGTGGDEIFGTAYTTFQPFFELSIAGLPFAVARLIALYNAREDYYTSDRMLRYSQRLMLSLGVIFFLLYVVITPFYAQLRVEKGEYLQPLIMGMYAIAPALIFLPFMSGMRGYLQGFHTIVGVSLSQITEQFARIVVLLSFIYVALYFWQWSPLFAAAFGLLSVILATLVSLVTLLPFYVKLRREHKRLIKRQEKREEYKTSFLLRQLMVTAIPFVFTNFATTLYSQITLNFFQSARIISAKIGNYYTPEIIDIAGREFTIINQWSDKMVSIPLTFSMALSVAIISFITSAYEKKDMQLVRKYTIQSYRMVILSTLASVIGLSMLSVTVINLFYGYDLKLSNILSLDGFRGVFFAFEVITISILQGLGKRKRAIIYSYLGPVVKLICLLPLVYFLGAYGEVLSTIIGLLFVVGFTSFDIFSIAQVNFRKIISTLCKTSVASIPMIIIIGICNIFLQKFYMSFYLSRQFSIIYLAIIVPISMSSFVFVGNKIGLIADVFGTKMTLRELVTNKIFKKRE